MNKMTLNVAIRQPQNLVEIEKFIQICQESRIPNVLATPRQDKDYLSLLAIKNNSVIGGFVCFIQSEEGKADLDAIAVQEQFRQQGIGSLLIEELKDKLRQIGIKTLSLVPINGSECYYLKKGFAYDVTDENYVVFQL